MTVDLTQVLLAAITMIGTVSSAYFASRAGRHSRQAGVSADRAVAASLRPPVSVVGASEWASLQPPRDEP
jgi:hypothetical protein